MEDLFNYCNPATRSVTPMISPAVHDIVVKNSERFNSAIIYDRDYLYNYFGFKVCVCRRLILPAVNCLAVCVCVCLYVCVFVD